MTKLTLTQVSKEFQIHRSTIYRAVDTGKLSRSSDGKFDLAEVIRCFGEPKKVATSQQNVVATPQQSSNEELERLKREFSEFKRQALDREEWLKGQIDRMQTLLELKSQHVAPETSQQQSQTTERDKQDKTLQRSDNKEFDTNETSDATVQKHDANQHSNVADETVRQPEKRRGLFGRLIRAVIE